MLVTAYSQKMLAYKCLTKSSLKYSEIDKQYSLHRFELFMAMLLRIHVFWNVMLCQWGEWLLTYLKRGSALIFKQVM